VLTPLEKLEYPKMRKRRITKKVLESQERHKARVEAFLESLGAVRGEGYDLDRWRLQTPLGEMMIHPYENWIACRFEDVEAAFAWASKNTLHLPNRYSGKWNWHWFDTPLDLKPEEEFQRMVRKILATGSETP
jgi:hypothetical protein